MPRIVLLSIFLIQLGFINVVSLAWSFLYNYHYIVLISALLSRCTVGHTERCNEHIDNGDQKYSDDSGIIYFIRPAYLFSIFDIVSAIQYKPDPDNDLKWHSEHMVLYICYVVALQRLNYL